MSKKIISLKNLDFSYGDTSVLKKLNIDILQNEFFTFLGPSGSGKSTILRLIAGLEKQYKGSLSIKGNTGIVFQDLALWPHMTVFQNISFGLEEKGYNKEHITAEVNNMLTTLGLSTMENRYPYQLSGGQQQRVALARTLIVKPDILLLDEPLSKLDTRLRVDMRQELTNIHRKFGTTTILVTHDHKEALQMSDRIAVINKGSIVQVDEPTRLFNSPASSFVQNFLKH